MQLELKSFIPIILDHLKLKTVPAQKQNKKFSDFVSLKGTIKGTSFRFLQ